MHLTGRRIVFGIEKYFDGTRSRYQSQKFGIWIQYLDISYLVRSHDTGYDITVNRDIWSDITPRITSEHQANTNSQETHHLVPVYSCFFRLCLCPRLGLSSVWPFTSSFSCPSAGRITGLTVLLIPANSNLRTRPAPWAHVLVSFSYFSFFPCLFPSWYLVPYTR